MFTYGIIAVAQLRPEKDHPLMIRSFHKLFDLLTDEEKKRVKLVLVGFCRNKEDDQRVKIYRKLCEELNVNNPIDFHFNVAFYQLNRLMEESTIGLHAMWNEHFGTSIVETGMHGCGIDHGSSQIWRTIDGHCHRK